MPSRWCDRLRNDRHALFVGRRHEQAMLHRLMRHPDARLWFVHGPVGIGKTALARNFQGIAETREWDCERIEADAFASPARYLDAASRLRSAPALLIVDDYDHAPQTHAWFRDTFLPQLADTVRVVIMSEDSPDGTWTLDAGWRSLLHVHELGPLSLRETEELLSKRSASAPSHALHAPPSSATATSLANPGDADSDRVVDGALQLLREGGQTQRELVALAAVNRFVSPPLLDDDAEVDMNELLEQPMFEHGELGPSLRDKARRSVLNLLRTEYPTLRTKVVRRSFERTIAQLETAESATARDAWLNNGVSLVAVDQLGESSTESEAPHSDHPNSADIPTILQVVGRCFGRSARRLAARWLELDPQGAVVGREPGGEIIGYCHFTDPLALPPVLGRIDPALRAVSAWFEQHVTDGATINMCRFFCPTAGSFRLDNPASAYLMTEMQRRLLLSGDDIVMSVQPRWVLEQLAAWGQHPICAEFEDNGTAWAVCAYDLRVQAPTDVIRARLHPGQIPAPDNAAFKPIVRRALRDFHRSHRLSKSPLAHWFGFVGDSDRVAAAIRDVLRSTVDRFGDHGDDARLAQIIEATYFATPTKQRAVASDLGMGFSTYRRHLQVATMRLTTGLREALANNRELPPATRPRAS